MEDQISENRLQSDCFLHAHNTYPSIRGLLFKITNESPKLPGETTKQFVARLSRAHAMGLIPGVCDLLLIHPLTCFEFKLPTGVQSPEQIAWQILVQANGIPYHIIRSLEQFQEIFRRIVGVQPQHLS